MLNQNETAEDIIERLKLQRHVEGGWFVETYRSKETVECPEREGRTRSILTTIHYLLSTEEPYGLLNRNTSDIVHFHEGGGVLKYTTVSPEGKLEENLIGPGHDRQLMVPAKHWKGTELIQGDWALVGEAVSPGFEYCDMDMDDGSQIKANFPEHYEALKPFYKTKV